MQKVKHTKLIIKKKQRQKTQTFYPSIITAVKSSYIALVSLVTEVCFEWAEISFHYTQ